MDFLNCVLEDNKIHSINDPVLKSLAEWQKDGLVYIYKVDVNRIRVERFFFSLLFLVIIHANNTDNDDDK